MSHLHDRIIDISRAHHLSHLGSCLTAVNIIDEIYQFKKPDELFILSCGHAGLALYVVLEKYFKTDAEQLYLKHGTHPNRDLNDKIHCSTGSLGLGLTVALGMALADRSKNVYCLISDGEASEGTMWETANIMAKYHVNNLKLYINCNGYTAYDRTDSTLIPRLKSIFPCINVRLTDTRDYGLCGLKAHYIRL